MAQVDYIHYFSNVISALLLFIVMYIIVSLYYVQYYYKIFRLRHMSYINIVYILNLKNNILKIIIDFLIKSNEKKILYLISFLKNLLKKKNVYKKNICL
jgi:hypothetical protein